MEAFIVPFSQPNSPLSVGLKAGARGRLLAMPRPWGSAATPANKTTTAKATGKIAMPRMIPAIEVRVRPSKSTPRRVRRNAVSGRTLAR